MISLGVFTLHFENLIKSTEPFPEIYTHIRTYAQKYAHIQIPEKFEYNFKGQRALIPYMNSKLRIATLVLEKISP